MWLLKVLCALNRLDQDCEIDGAERETLLYRLMEVYALMNECGWDSMSMRMYAYEVVSKVTVSDFICINLS